MIATVVDGKLAELDRQLLIRKDYSPEQVEDALKIMASLVDSKTPKKIKSQGEFPPCTECGSVEFLRTGTCYTCLNCSSSTGCA